MGKIQGRNWISGNFNMFKMTTRFLQMLSNLRRDTRGMSGILLAVSMIPIIGVIGIATDVGRAYIVKARLSAALDAAALAGGRSFFEANRDAQIQKYFEANFPSGFMGATVSGPHQLAADGTVHAPGYTYPSTEKVLRLKADVNMPTLFMRLFDHDDMDVGGNAEVTREVALLDVVIAIDMSLSMQWGVGGGGSGGTSRIELSKTAAQTLVNVLFGSNSVNALLNIGLVPWAGSVNVTQNGSTYGEDEFGNPVVGAARYTAATVAGSPANPYLEANYTYQTSVTSGGSWHWEGYGWNRHKVWDVQPTVTTTDHLLLKNYQTNLANVYYAHNAPTIPLLAIPEDGWEGCVYARYAREHAWDQDSDGDGDTPLYGQQSAIDNAADVIDGPYNPAGGPAWLGWYPMGSERSDNNCELAKLNNTSGDCASCIPNGITAMQHSKQVITDAISALSIVSGSYTNIPQGLAWGWRAVTSQQPFTESEVVPAEVTKHRVVILLTDGENSRGQGDAYNFAVSGAGTSMYSVDQRDDRLKTLAANIRDDDVIVYAIQFANDSNDLKILLRDYVAKDAGHYYQAPTGDQLNSIFTKIANELASLRLSK